MARLGRKTATALTQAWEELQNDPVILAAKTLPNFEYYQRVMMSQFKVTPAEIAEEEPFHVADTCANCKRR